MYLELKPGGRPSLQEAENFRTFKLMVHGTPERLAEAAAAFAGLARFEDASHAWVDAAALCARPEVAGDAAWQAGFAAMVDKARPHGWVHPQTGAIRAHVEWVG